MNKNAIIGYALVGAAGVLAAVLASTDGGWARDFFGKAVWCLPYVALMGGVRTLAALRR